MKQNEMSKYLKFITVGVGIFLLAFIFWFLPTVLKETLLKLGGENTYWGVCIFIWFTAVPCFFCLIHFWRICTRIGLDQSFSRENAAALKRMSQYMILDALLYGGFLLWFCIVGWADAAAWLFFPILLAIFISVTLAVLCAVLSYLVHKASRMQEDQDLTI